MFLARYNSKQKIGLVAVILVIILVLGLIVFNKLNDTKNAGQKASETDVEVKVLRSQEEITTSYKKTMERIIARLEEVESREDIVLISENSFFDFFVPNDLMDLHLQKMLEVNRLLEQSDLSEQELKAKVISAIIELKDENQKIIENLAKT
ncbi:MAG: hypothetical protein A2725_01340 [Candidatus Magasanikbacteria bacterium RIFCSPHIGHO2_01_FULL_33_34]|uniref:Uncharacterized protein n=1 Tax=Candidatus Magasanikbacteria bacterium RIFCSPHIGHO2_01_FULL_33_34 TaxID=1798671 RepID=A0A1F6LJH6_9BACT|nr:MAG: hypothetical protein A2725_01340 [Candidatus Magasanikbacteria bacterium RIFCSPHIGHO2_01_FULL_33_34]OGH65463.1 MAG: hypothetical protein A3B83_01095 [Candidatus Magasanikbacteria bacterium RIFCSPHIGHO2_02_FULL_33_17]OGH76173.1 MAG: hypothetical protein A3A89_01915 [Candidatus Magasanikbacteria bacterium RIFCSPLOWO2_01_FULL_33_34]OGH81013.1 MAG: hypothetical protein A3F93_04510 [Candidatus Magasanikbacteria bacterium RIFCSPLOWO2_12_FULL_34_7]